VRDDKAFGKEIQRLMGSVRKSQFEIGRLIHCYIEVNGNSYDGGVYKHIADLANVAKRSAYNYHRAYRLLVEFNCANLHNLGHCMQYEIARLLEHSRKAEVVPEAVAEVSRNRWRVNDLASWVDEKLKLDGKKKPKPEPKDNPSPPRLEFTAEHQIQLVNAVEAIELLKSEDSEMSEKVPFADHLKTIGKLYAGLNDYLRKLADTDEADNIEPIVIRAIGDLAVIGKALKHQKQQSA